ncbi:Type I restriction-modification system restriction subunit R [Geitlerinema sp. FC II]|nr:Type I restriction-modification system restriction subunit R [Geitlerinema sp. FC II]
MSLRDRLRSILDGLTDKANINPVREQLDRIEDAREESWWINVTPTMLEALRRHLRDLVRFVDRDLQNLVYTQMCCAFCRIRKASKVRSLPLRKFSKFQQSPKKPRRVPISKDFTG